MAQFRNESGAFDLPSILVGVVVVGILTAGVLAAIFGVIPFAQDKAAQQDLDAVRTAEGVTKAQDGAFKPTLGLTDRGLLNGNVNAAADTDTGGSCYAAVAKSGSGKLFFSTSSTPSPEQLIASSAVGCITPAQLQAMINSLGGSAPAPGGGSSAVFANTENAPDAVVAFMNADVAYNGAPEYLQGIQPGDDFSYPNYDALLESPVQATWDAAYAALYSDAEAASAYNQLMNRSDAGIPGLLTARWDADANFWNDPTPETQKAAVDALRALYTAALEAPRMTFPASFDGASYTQVDAPAIATQDSALQVRYARAELAYMSSQAYLYQTVASATGSSADSNGYRAALNASAVGKEWLYVTQDPTVMNVYRTSNDNITGRTDAGIPELYADVQAKKSAFQSSNELADAAAKQQAYVDALRLMYTTAFATPPVHSDLHAVPVGSSVTVTAGTATTVHLEMRLPSGSSVDKNTLQVEAYGYLGSATFDEPRLNGGDLWSMNMDVYAYQKAGTYPVVFKLKDPVSGLSFYHQFSVVVQ